MSKIYNFADALKQDICINMLDMTNEQCYGDDVAKNTLTKLRWEDMPGYDDSWRLNKDYDSSGFMTARQVMQFVGTDIFRKMKNDIWAKATLSKIKQEKPKLAIVADCRFPNEVEAIRDAGGIVIKLNRNPYNSDHSSEVALDDINYSNKNFHLVINNDILSIDEQNTIILNFLIKKDMLPK
jgi:hypothetical protein